MDLTNAKFLNVICEEAVEKVLHKILIYLANQDKINIYEIYIVKSKPNEYKTDLYVLLDMTDHQYIRMRARFPYVYNVECTERNIATIALAGTAISGVKYTISDYICGKRPWL